MDGLLDRGSALQLTRFVLVGVSNTLLSFAVYALLVGGGAPSVLAAAVAFSAGAVNGYVLNCRWTFAARDTHRARIAYVLVQALGLLSSSALVWAAVDGLGTGRLAGYALAIPPVTLATFLANRAWTFAPHPSPATHARRRSPWRPRDDARSPSSP